MATCATCLEEMRREPLRTLPLGGVSLNCDECWEFRVRAGRVNVAAKAGPRGMDCSYGCGGTARYIEGGWWRCPNGHSYQTGAVRA